MTPADFAATITGEQYPFGLGPAQVEIARMHGLVVVYGASDDLIVFEGAIRDELGVYDGGTAYVDAKGVLPERESIDDDDELRDYFERHPKAATIEAVWAEGEYSWQYRTEIPHATFEVLEDDDTYCRGIVFALAELRA